MHFFEYLGVGEGQNKKYLNAAAGLEEISLRKFEICSP
jgi:hypothetical protein